MHRRLRSATCAGAPRSDTRAAVAPRALTLAPPSRPALCHLRCRRAPRSVTRAAVAPRALALALIWRWHSDTSHLPRSGACSLLALALRHPRTCHALSLALFWRLHSDTCTGACTLSLAPAPRALTLAPPSRPALRHSRRRRASRSDSCAAVAPRAPTPAHSPRSGTCSILALALRHPRTRHAPALALSWRRHSDTLCHLHWRLHSVTRAGACTLALALAPRAPTPAHSPRSGTCFFLALALRHLSACHALTLAPALAL